MAKRLQLLDCVLVPAGLIIMVGYHLWLLYRIKKHPTQTTIGINAINRRLWVEAIMQDSKNSLLAVQTFRNNILASTLLASTAITLSSVITVVMAPARNHDRTTGDHTFGLMLGDRSQLSVSIKFSSILVCFLLAFLLTVQSLRYYNHATILINVPFQKMASPYLSVAYVVTIVNRGLYFWSLGLRAFYFSFPLFMWIFGPLPMCFSSVCLVILLYFLDVTMEFRAVGRITDDHTDGSIENNVV